MLTIGVIGAGQIGSAIAKVLAETGKYEIIASRRKIGKVRDLEKLGVKLTRMNREVAKESDVIFISVKPYKVPEILNEVSDLLRNKLLISVAAAISISKLQKLAPEAKIVRAMPNIALKVKTGFIAYSRGPKITEEDINLVRELFSEMGYCMEVDEGLMDAVTALSGSGPAYVAIMIEAMAHAGLKVG
ncbi:MAG TPA: pyrroline-5-carboxylate reductase, partial [Nitrososphaeria archaeon]|nr:pyrroline-5-carboxylate reductase [Nitrososphaeria archaeon]